MTTYAVAPEVPERKRNQLTAGKRYEVTDDAITFIVIDDRGDQRLCRWAGCAHLDGGSWERVETDEEGIAIWTPPEDGVPPPDWQEGWEWAIEWTCDVSSGPTEPMWKAGTRYFYRPPQEEERDATYDTLTDEQLVKAEAAIKAERQRRADPDREYRLALADIFYAWGLSRSALHIGQCASPSVRDRAAIAALRAFDERER